VDGKQEIRGGHHPSHGPRQASDGFESSWSIPRDLKPNGFYTHFPFPWLEQVNCNILGTVPKVLQQFLRILHPASLLTQILQQTGMMRGTAVLKARVLKDAWVTEEHKMLPCPRQHDVELAVDGPVP